jgi:Peptidase family M23
VANDVAQIFIQLLVDKAAARKANRDLQQYANRAGKAYGDAFDQFRGSKLGQEAFVAAEQLKKLYSVAGLAGTAIQGLVTAVGAAVGALGTMAGTVGYAAGALAVLPGIFSVVAQAGASAIVSFKGVGSALSEGFKAASTGAASSGGAASAAAKSNEAALKRIADAQDRLNKVILTNRRRLSDAQRTLSRTVESSNEKMQASARDVADAETDLRDAQNKVVGAQNVVRASQLALTAARKAGREELQQLNFALKGSVLGEQRAFLSLEEARKSFVEAQKTYQPGDLEYRSAALSVKEASLAYEEAKDRAHDLSDTHKIATKQGLEGTDAYRTALGDNQQAEQDLADARRDAAEKQRALDDARITALRDQRDAIRDIRDAERDLRRARQDANSDLKDAKKDLEDAKKELKAGGDAAAASAGQTDKFAEALAKLSPSAQTFVKKIVGMKDRFSAFKKAVQEPFFDAFNDAFFRATDKLLPAFQDGLSAMSGALGRVGATFADTLSQGEGFTLLKDILTENVDIFESLNAKTRTGRSTIGNLVIVTERFLKAIQPLTHEFFHWIRRMSSAWEETTRGKDAMERMEGTFKRWGDRFKTVMNLLKSAGGVLKNFASATDNVGVDNIERMTESFNRMSRRIQGNRNAVRIWADNASRTMRNTAPAWKALLDGLFGQKAMASAEEASRILGEGLVDPLNKILGAGNDAVPALAELFVTVADIIAEFAQSGGLKLFIDLLTQATGVVRDFLDLPIVSTIIKFKSLLFGVGAAYWLFAKAFRFFALGAVGSLLGVNKLLAPLAGRLEQLAAYSLFGGRKAQLTSDAAIAAAASTRAALDAMVLRTQLAALAMSGAFSRAWTGITTGFSRAMGLLGQAWGARGRGGGFLGGIKGMGPVFSNLWSGAKAGGAKAADAVGKAFKGVGRGIAGSLKGISTMAGSLIGGGPILGGIALAGAGFAAWRGYINSSKRSLEEITTETQKIAEGWGSVGSEINKIMDIRTDTTGWFGTKGPETTFGSALTNLHKYRTELKKFDEESAERKKGRSLLDEVLSAPIGAATAKTMAEAKTPVFSEADLHAINSMRDSIKDLIATDPITAAAQFGVLWNSFDEGSGDLGRNSDEMKGLKGQLERIGVEIDNTTGRVQLNTESVEGWTTAMNWAKSNASNMANALRDLVSGLDLEKSNADFEKTAASMQKIVFQGKRLNPDDALAYRDAWIKNLETLKSTGASTDQVKKSYREMRRSFLKSLTDMGMDAKKAKKETDRIFGNPASVTAVITGKGKLRAEARLTGKVIASEINKALAHAIVAHIEGDPPEWVTEILAAEAWQKAKRIGNRIRRQYYRDYGPRPDGGASTNVDRPRPRSLTDQLRSWGVSSGPSIQRATATDGSAVARFSGAAASTFASTSQSLSGSATRAGGVMSVGGVDLAAALNQKSAAASLGSLISEFMKLIAQMSNLREEYGQLDDSSAQVWQNQQTSWQSSGKPTYISIDKAVSDTAALTDRSYRNMAVAYANSFTKVSGRWSTKDKLWLRSVGEDLVAPFDSFGNYLNETNSKGFIGKNARSMAATKAVFDSGAGAITEIWDKLPRQMGSAINPGLTDLNSKVIDPMKETLRAFPGGAAYANKMTHFPKFARGGFVSGPGTGTSDSIMAKLSAGEFVMNSKQTRKYRRLLEMLNKGKKLSHNDIWNYIFGPGGGPWWDDKGSRKSQRILTGAGLDGLAASAPDHSLAWVLKSIAQRGTPTVSASGLAMVGPILTYGLNALQREVANVGKLIQDKREAAYLPPFIHPLGRDHPQAVPDHDPNIRPGFTTRSVYNPGNSSYRPHGGADLVASSGDPLYAVSAGKVVMAGAYGDAGNFVKILFRNGMGAGYAHLSKIGVRLGQQVRTGQLIGRVGSTGNSTGPHLHFSIYDKSGSLIDPEKYMLNSHKIKLARGGYVSPRSGGVQAILAEAGKTERVEPLDSKGLSNRDKDIVDRLDKLLSVAGGNGGTLVKVFIGDEELRSVVRSEIRTQYATTARSTVTGRRRMI